MSDRKTTIVVLRNGQTLSDRSWCCNHKGEADRLAKWLRDNHILADALTTEEWNLLSHPELIR